MNEKQITGKVQYVNASGGSVKLYVGGELYDIEDLYAVRHALRPGYALRRIRLFRHKAPAALSASSLRLSSSRLVVAQLATFSQLEQLQNLNATYEKSQAFSLIGKDVILNVEDETGREKQITATA